MIEEKDKSEEQIPHNPQTEEAAPTVAEPKEEAVAPAAEKTEAPASEKQDPESTLELMHSSTNAADDDDEWWKSQDDYSPAEHARLEAMYTSTLREFEENEIVTGTVGSIGEKEVVMNIGFKSEGIIPINEFRDVENLKAGDEVEVFIEKIEDHNGQLLLSRRRAKRLRSWERIISSMEGDTILMGYIMRRTKGGFVVDIDGIEAFLPGSQIDVKPVRDFDAFVGRTMEFKVVKINHAYENVVVSHKILIEAKLEEQRELILQNLEKGQVLEGMVKNMTDFGVFIDLGGVDGLLHITDISWGRINHPSQVLELDQQVNVVVLDFDDAKKRISLGMKQLTSHPWDSLPETIFEGARVKGKVVTVADYGIFLEILPGVEGLIHTSEMSWSSHVKNPSETFKVGDELDAVILNVDREERKMSLGIKQLGGDPWDKILEKYPVGSTHSGLVRNMTNYGLFVELEEGVDGLVHISDLSWTKKFAHPSDFTSVGDELEVLVLDIDISNRRLSLGHKQLTEDVWETFATIFTLGSTHTGTIKKVDSRGNATIELDYGIEGTVTPGNMKVEEGKEALKVDDSAQFVVVEFNKDAKRLALSHTRIWKKEPEKKKAPATRAKAPEAKAGSTSLGDIGALAQLKQQMEAQEKKGKAPAKKASAKKAVAKTETPKAEAEEPKAKEAKVEEPKAETEAPVETEAKAKPAAKKTAAKKPAAKKTTKAAAKKKEEPAKAEEAKAEDSPEAEDKKS